jgi:hypothetical protein
LVKTKRLPFGLQIPPPPAAIVFSGKESKKIKIANGPVTGNDPKCNPKVSTGWLGLWKSCILQTLF